MLNHHGRPTSSALLPESVRLPGCYLLVRSPGPLTERARARESLDHRGERERGGGGGGDRKAHPRWSPNPQGGIFHITLLLLDKTSLTRDVVL